MDRTNCIFYFSFFFVRWKHTRNVSYRLLGWQLKCIVTRDKGSGKEIAKGPKGQFIIPFFVWFAPFFFVDKSPESRSDLYSSSPP